MPRHLKKHSHLLLTFLTLALIITGALFAGTLTPPTDIPAPTMYTLDDIYNLIHNNATSTHSLSTSTSPAKSMYSVSNIYADLANLIDPANLAPSTTYLGVTAGGASPDPVASYAPVFTPANSAGNPTGYTLDDIYHLIHDNIRPTTTVHAFTPPGTITSSQHDLNQIYTDLATLITPANVKAGVTYLGVTGTYAEFVANPVWVANQTSNSVSKINGSTDNISATVAVGAVPYGVAVDASGNVWVSNRNSNSVSKINGSTNTVISTIPVGRLPQGVAVDSSGNIWVTSLFSNSVMKINGSTHTTTTVTVGTGPAGVAADARGNIWVTNNTSNSVSKINGSTNTVIATLSGINSPQGIAVDASGNIWVANSGDYNYVTKINGLTNSVITTVLVGSAPIGIAVDASGNIWVANSNSNSVSKINGSTNTLSSTIAVGSMPYGVAVDADGNVWAVNYNSNSVSKINGSTNTVSTTVAVGGYPRSVGDFTGYALQHFVIDVIPPTVTLFSIPATYSSTTVPITSFTATDNGIITGYKLTESDTPPLPGDGGWTPATSTTYTFASTGTSTLYAWAKDAAGNVSVAQSGVVNITLPDPCGVSPVIGGVCTGGALYAGVYNGYKYMTTPSDVGYKKWSDLRIVTSATDLTDGLINTNNLAPRGSGYEAAYYCVNTERTGGYTDWYLPSKNELNNVLYLNKTAIGGFDTVVNWPSPNYWSSTEFNNSIAHYQSFNDGYQNGDDKTYTYKVRCIRRYSL